MNVVLHIDEIFLKGKNQNLFIRKLINNINFLFKGVVVRRTDSASFVVENINKEEDLLRLSKIPGIANLSPVEISKNDIESIKKMIDKLEFESNIKTFRISAVRSNKKYKLKSRDIEILLGDYVREKYKWAVDLKNYDTKITIEIGLKQARVYNKIIKGVGGLPTGSSGKVFCLLSGGIDSPVAAYTMMKRGAEIALVHFQNETEVSDEVSKKIIDLVNVLSKYQPKIKLHIIPFANLQREVIMKVPSRYRMIVSRRLMFKIAEEISKNEKNIALATGDSLGQVASQTLENMNAIYNATDMLKLTPLIGMNKSEIIKIANNIGTLEISNRPYEDCCSLFVAKHPETKAKLEDVLKIEERLEIQKLDKKKIITYHISIN